MTIAPLSLVLQISRVKNQHHPPKINTWRVALNRRRAVYHSWVGKQCSRTLKWIQVAKMQFDSRKIRHPVHINFPSWLRARVCVCVWERANFHSRAAAAARENPREKQKFWVSERVETHLECGKPWEFKFWAFLKVPGCCSRSVSVVGCGLLFVAVVVSRFAAAVSEWQPVAFWSSHPWSEI